jgi:phosphate acetyltransferase
VLGAEVLYGERYLENLVFGFRIASMQLMPLLERLEPGALVITSGDRADILLGLMASQMSSKTPSLAGVLLSSGLRPTETLDRVIRGLRNTQLPVLLVNTGTYQTAIDVSNVAPRSPRRASARSRRPASCSRRTSTPASSAPASRRPAAPA